MTLLERLRSDVNHASAARTGAASPSSLTSFGVMRQRIHRAAEVLGLPEDMAEQIAQPRRVIELNLLIEMDDGSRGLFQAWRVQHNSTRALQGMKGGLKVSADQSADETIALAAGMTIKNSLVGLPLGGAKGAISADPRALSEGEKERLIRRYALEISPDLGSPGNWIDVPAPDMGTSAKDMAIFADTISRLHGGFTPGVVTGKPIEIGGIPGRVKATGHGVAHIASLAIDLDGARCLVSGFGNVGQFAATGVESCGAAVCAVIDPYLGGVLYRSAGISCVALADFLAVNGRSATSFVEFAESFEGHEVLDVDELLRALDSMPIDVFLPCAAPQSVHSDFAAALVSAGVKIVVEGANSPLTPSAELVFAAAATQIVPDVLANAGGVVCSYLEMSKAASMTLPTETETLANVSSILTDAWARTTEYNRRYNLGNDLRLTADTVAVADIAAVHTLRGIF